jgi:AraC family transcriptional regulator, ethanolamine operon transcriptional activator
MFSLEAQNSRNLEALSAMQYGWDFSAIQLEDSHQPSDITLIQSDNAGYNQFRFNTALDQHLHVRPGYFSFGILEPDCPSTWLGNQVIPANGLIIFPHEEQANAVSCAGFHGNGMHFREDYLAGLTQAVFKESLQALIPNTGIYALNSLQVQSLRHELNKWHSLINQGAAARPGIMARREESLALAILSSLKSTAQQAYAKESAHHRVLDSALEYIHGHVLENISVAELCLESGCSERWLGICFKKRYNVTPKKYIKCLRLAHVRRNLIKFDSNNYDSIIEVAADQGFWHMGQFAADYRSIYGELPSETLKECGQKK